MCRINPPDNSDLQKFGKTQTLNHQTPHEDLQLLQVSQLPLQQQPSKSLQQPSELLSKERQQQKLLGQQRPQQQPANAQVEETQREQSKDFKQDVSEQYIQTTPIITVNSTLEAAVIDE